MFIQFDTKYGDVGLTPKQSATSFEQGLFLISFCPCSITLGLCQDHYTSGIFIFQNVFNLKMLYRDVVTRISYEINASFRKLLAVK